MTVKTENEERLIWDAVNWYNDPLDLDEALYDNLCDAIKAVINERKIVPPGIKVIRTFCAQCGEHSDVMDVSDDPEWLWFCSETCYEQYVCRKGL